MEQKKEEKSDTADEKEADTVVKIGATVGALGVGAHVVLGAVCPVCYVVAPALIGAGIIKKKRLKKGENKA